MLILGSFRLQIEKSVLFLFTAIEELKNYSPLNSPRNQSPMMSATVERAPTIIKSNSDVSCNFAGRNFV